MEFSFELYSWLNSIQKEPAIMVAICAFGTPLFIATIAIISAPFFKRVSSSIQTAYGILLAMPLVITWLLGFFISVCLMFSGVEGIRIFLVIFVIYVCAFIFCLSNLGLLSRWVEDMAPSKKTKKKQIVI